MNQCMGCQAGWWMRPLQVNGHGTDAVMHEVVGGYRGELVACTAERYTRTTINDLLAEFGDAEFTAEMFCIEKSALEVEFLAVHGIAASDIDGTIRNHTLPCTNRLVERWIELHALEPYLDLTQETT